MEIYPLVLERKLDHRIWGGTQLIEFLQLPEPHPERIAECWLVYDDNQVLNGEYAGLSLAEVTQHMKGALLGNIPYARYGSSFPLLAKFIDAAQDLSVQVHPDDAYARQEESNSGFLGKSEAWVILRAESDAFLYYHLERPVSREEFAQAVADNRLTELLHCRKVQEGDVISVPAGTVHTINQGIMLFEIQQKSDLTYRVYDYGRPRPLHLEKALDVIAYDRPPPPPVTPVSLPAKEGADGKLLLGTHNFAIEQWQVHSSSEWHTSEDSLEILAVIAGEGELNWKNGSIELSRGSAVVLPAQLGEYEIVSHGEHDTDLDLIRCYVPDPIQLNRRMQILHSSSVLENVLFF